MTVCSVFGTVPVMAKTGGPYHALAPQDKREARRILIARAFGNQKAAAIVLGVHPTLIAHMAAGRRGSPMNTRRLLEELRRRLGPQRAKLWNTDLAA